MKTFPDDKGESFAEFSARTLPEMIETAKVLKTVLFVPLGDYSEAHRKVLVETSKLVSIIYGIKTQWLSPLKIEFPSNSKSQLHVLKYMEKVLDTLDTQTDPPAEDLLSIVLITDKDLYSEDEEMKLNFLFGVSPPDSSFR